MSIALTGERLSRLKIRVPGMETIRQRRVVAWLGFSLLGLVTIFALCVPLIAGHDPLVPAGMPLQKPGTDGFVLGTDSIGRDIESRVLYGIRASWFAALAVVAIGLLIGGLVGLVAGAAGGWIDSVLMRITDAFLALPAPVLAIAVVAALGPGFVHTLIAVSIVWWPFYARLVRGEITRLAARPHVEAARLSGVGRIRVALRHLLPGAVPNALVAASLDIGTLILTLAALSFLGLGQAAPAPELGADAARNLSYFLQQWWIPVMPGIGVMALALIGNISGDSLRTLMIRD
ncbi:ABC transporter permease [Gordonia jinhuaensis]|uniref:Peptide ABC transporter permease n=1 Tax=Gordonia jinhuaensis TaxID=1517702 RepID=A0A916T354_9ACTN|nr:ABC transporter permease [Gordonia jinhuaensis]GGB28474.1 peptide ABC transporter permease [Gordonia jinhuaensis]